MVLWSYPISPFPVRFPSHPATASTGLGRRHGQVWALPMSAVYLLARPGNLTVSLGKIQSANHLSTQRDGMMDCIQRNSHLLMLRSKVANLACSFWHGNYCIWNKGWLFKWQPTSIKYWWKLQSSNSPLALHVPGCDTWLIQDCQCLCEKQVSKPWASSFEFFWAATVSSQQEYILQIRTVAIFPLVNRLEFIRWGKENYYFNQHPPGWALLADSTITPD